MDRKGEFNIDGIRTYCRIVLCFVCIMWLILFSACGREKKDEIPSEPVKEEKMEAKEVKEVKPIQKVEIPSQMMWPYIDWQAYKLGETSKEVSYGSGTWLDITGSGNVQGHGIKINNGSNGIRYFSLWKYGNMSDEIYGFQNDILVVLMEHVQTRHLTVGKVLEYYGFSPKKIYAYPDIIKTNDVTNEYTARWRVKNGYLAISYTTYEGMGDYLSGYAWKVLVAKDYNISTLFDCKNARTVNSGALSDLGQAKEELSRHGDFGNLVQIVDAGPSGWIGKISNEDIVIMDRESGRVALVRSNDILHRIAREAAKGNSYDLVRAKFQIYNDKRDNDEDNGSWQGNVHILPVQMEYQVENGRVVPGMLKSGSGDAPDIYNNYLYEQKNVDMVNMFLRNAPELYNKQ